MTCGGLEGLVLQVRMDRPDARISQLGNLLVVDWVRAIRAQYIEKLEAIIRDVAAGHERPIAVLVLIRESTPLPDGELRRQLQASLGRVETCVGAMASVIEGEDVRAFTVRAIFNGVRTLTRSRHPHRAFGTVDAALSWLAAEMRTNPEVSWTSADVLTAMGSMPA